MQMTGVSKFGQAAQSHHEAYSEMTRLRRQFLLAQLELSFTLATFVQDGDRDERLRKSCYSTALKGYRSAVAVLAKVTFEDGDRQVLDSKLERLRLALGSPEAIESAWTVRLRIGPPVGDSGGHLQAHRVVNGPGDAPKCDSLTRREREVLKWIAEGYSTKELASLLGITFKTASCHRTRIMDKLGIHNLATLVRYAIREQIIRP